MSVMSYPRLTMTLSPEAFVSELDAQNQVALERIATLASAGEPSDSITVAKLLQPASSASGDVLAMAEELQEIARLEAGISRAPGC